MPREPLISLPEIARLHRRHKPTVFKIVEDLGLPVKEVEGEKTRGQRAAHISVQDYETHRLRFDVAHADSDDSGSLARSDSVFYLILTEPELDPGRFKVGFSTHMAGRVRDHQTSAPFSELVKTWPCEERWEKTAIDCVSEGCERLGPEMFRARDVKTVLRRADRFFELMPTPKGE